MIISQTPFRVSFAGGGTDLPAFYLEEPGAVLSTTINRHMYVTVHRRFEPTFRIAYSQIELAAQNSSISHELVREALLATGVTEPLEVTTIGDVPAGTGMGSSSTLTVGLLNAFHAISGRIRSAAQLAEDACRIEIDVLGKPIGRQDQYAAAYGGMNLICFHPDRSVTVEPVPCRAETLNQLEQRILLLYTNRTRSADGILQKQSDGTCGKISILRNMREIAFQMRYELCGVGDLDRFAGLLDEAWKLKRSLGFGISDTGIDAWYNAAQKAGAQGGKLLGAGGGGFVLLMAPPERHAAIRNALGNPKELRFSLDRQGSRIIFVNE
jgi:D-glycero-alpha-D-manno-heptose-7-phosphate kinase